MSSTPPASANSSRKFLEGYRGKLQTDGYIVYSDGVGGPGMVHAGCWAHARRGFIDAVKVDKDDIEAVQMVIRMDALFLLEREAREQGMDFQKRGEYRGQHMRSGWIRSRQGASI